MYGTIFLYVAAIFDDDAAPVAPNGSAGPYIYVSSDDYITRDGCLWMNEGAFMRYRDEVFKGVKHTD